MLITYYYLKFEKCHDYSPKTSNANSHGDTGIAEGPIFNHPGSFLAS